MVKPRNYLATFQVGDVASMGKVGDLLAFFSEAVLWSGVRFITFMGE